MPGEVRDAYHGHDLMLWGGFRTDEGKWVPHLRCLICYGMWHPAWPPSPHQECDGLGATYHWPMSECNCGECLSEREAAAAERRWLEARHAG